MGNYDRFILLFSLSVFFFCGALALVITNFAARNNETTSVMVSPTAQALAMQDPRPRAQTVVKLCYSEEKFVEQIARNGLGSGQILLARGVGQNGRPVEIYASSVLGYGGTFSVYEFGDSVADRHHICRVAHGRNLEILDPETAAIAQVSEREDIVTETMEISEPEGQQIEIPELNNNHELVPVEDVE